MWLYYLIVLVGTLASPAFASGALLPDLAFDAPWLKLLHYERTWSGGWRSRADGGGFFVAADGKHNPLSELQATIAALNDPSQRIGLLQQPASCAFPARRMLLTKLLNTQFPVVSCKDYDEWRTGLNAASISLVFSSAYANNPASMFGHSFLRLNSGLQPSSATVHELLHYGVSFQATVDDSNRDFLYAFKALTGLYPGQFSIMPYYMKVSEYSNSESRDLWEYQLNLSSEEVALLVAHLWEIFTTTYFDYYFQDENCSYQLLAMLEAARPTLNLKDKTSFFVLPSETIKIVASQPGLVGNVSFRPANVERLQARLDQLTAEQKKNVQQLLNGAMTAEQADTLTLQTAIEWLNMNKETDRQNFDKVAATRLHTLLTNRASRGPSGISEPKVATAHNRPDLGHGPHHLSLGALRQAETVQMGVGYKLGYHDILEPDRGYERLLQINFIELHASYDFKSQEALLNRLLIADILSLNPIGDLSQSPSWQARVGWDTVPTADGTEARSLLGDFRGGFAFDLGVMNTLYSMAGGGLSYSTDATNNGQILPLLALGILTKWSDRVKSMARLTRYWPWNRQWGTPTTHSDVAINYGLNEQFQIQLAAKAKTATDSLPIAVSIDLIYTY